MRQLLLSIGLMMGLLACSKSSNNNTTGTPAPGDPNLVIKNGIIATGAQQSTPNNSTGTASINVSYHKLTQKFSFSINWQGLGTVPNDMHFHGPADKGKDAGVVLFIQGFSKTTSGFVEGSIVLNNTTQKPEDLLGGKWYYNVHTTGFGGGEIRAQIEF